MQSKVKKSYKTAIAGCGCAPKGKHIRIFTGALTLAEKKKSQCVLCMIRLSTQKKMVRKFD